MENFIVSARKYRPQNFDSVVGQAHITTTLKNAIRNNQLAHAFLFCGPRGVGKTTCARILAKTINCENRMDTGEACNTCASCISFDKGSSMNIHELDAASNNSVEDIRNLVEQVRFAPQAGKYKVYIVDEVHMLTTAAFNAFLKTLEEPPPYAIFILATTEKHKIIPTILSRCQIFDFKRITNQDTVDHLAHICEKEKINCEKPALHLISQKSEGCLRDSLSILDKIISFTNGELSYENTLEHLNILDEDYFFKLTDAMQEQKVSDVLLLYNEINNKGFEGDQVLNAFSEFLRNLLVSKDAKVAKLLEVSDAFKKRYFEVANAVDVNWLLSGLNILNDFEIKYQQAKNKRLHVEMALIKLTFLHQALEISGVGGNTDKKKQIEAIKPVAFRSLSASHAPVPVKKEARTRVAKPENTAQSPNSVPQATVTIESGAEKPEPRAEETKSIVREPRASRISALKLKDIRQKVANDNKNKKSIPLTEEELKNAWQIFADRLAEANNHSGAANFNSAKLKIKGEKTIQVIVENNLHERFIDAERGELLHHLHTHFKNRFLTFEFVVEQSKVDTRVNEPTPMERYQMMTQKFPMVAELQQRLGLRPEIT